MLIFWITDKLDNESKKQWQLAHLGTSHSNWQDLVKVLDWRNTAFQFGKIKENSKAQSNNTNNSKLDHGIQLYSTVSVCNVYCFQSHKVLACPQFKNASVHDRTKLTKSKQFCFTWLQTGDNVSTCSCKYLWKECKMKYHTVSHCEWNLQAKSSDQKTVQVDACSCESEEEPRKVVVKSHCKASYED